MTETLQGLLLLDKPAGVTSFDCVAAVRRKLAVKRVGHCGTLDPAARGLLLILVGSATREQDSFLGLEKDYAFIAEFGRKTSTADLEGEVIDQKAFDHVTKERLALTLREFVGNVEQLPPMYSALKYKGKPYYAYARKGLSIPRVPRSITIHSFSLTSFASPYWEARVRCSRGTYVRTLVEDVAERMGTCSVLVELVRERIGPYKKENALSWQELRMIAPDDLASLLLPIGSEAVLVHA